MLLLTSDPFPNHHGYHLSALHFFLFFFTSLRSSSLFFSLCAQEYVDLYVDWLLSKSIAKQFDAFKKGFDLVMGESGLADLFTAEEVELLVCGCKVM